MAGFFGRAGAAPAAGSFAAICAEQVSSHPTDENLSLAGSASVAQNLAGKTASVAISGTKATVKVTTAAPSYAAPVVVALVPAVPLPVAVSLPVSLPLSATPSGDAADDLILPETTLPVSAAASLDTVAQITQVSGPRVAPVIVQSGGAIPSSTTPPSATPQNLESGGMGAEQSSASALPLDSNTAPQPREQEMVAGVFPPKGQLAAGVGVHSEAQPVGAAAGQMNAPALQPVNAQLAPGAAAVGAATILGAGEPASPSSGIADTEPIRGNDSEITADETSSAPVVTSLSLSSSLSSAPSEDSVVRSSVAPASFAPLEVQPGVPKRTVTDRSNAGTPLAVNKPAAFAAESVPSDFQAHVNGTLAAVPVELQPVPALPTAQALPVASANSGANANAASAVTPAPNGNSLLSGPAGANHNPGTTSADGLSSGAPAQNANANKDSNASAAANATDPMTHSAAAVITAQTAGLQSAPAQSSTPPQPAAVVVNGPAAQVPASQTAVPASAPKANNGGAANGGDTPANAAASELPPPPAVAPVQMAQMVNKAAQTEMRIGLNTSAFGSVEVHTVVHANDVGVVIGSEKGDLHSLMANDLPGIANTLQQQNLRLSQVNFHQGSGFSGNLSSGSDSQPRYFARPPSASLSSAEGRGSDSEPSAAEGARDVSAGLNILA
jgi:hypothetical protein